MRISELKDADLSGLPNDELLNLHLRLHQLYGRTKQFSEEELQALHEKIVEEMLRRDLKHVSELDKSIEEAMMSDIVVTPDFISIAGSAVKEYDPQDIDIVIRAEREGEYYKIRYENINLPLRKVLDPDKTGNLHYIPNPQGPHSDYIALYDLVLRPKPPEIKVVKAKPGQVYELQTPKMSLYTEFFSAKELWEKWGEAQVKEYGYLLASPKIDGFRLIVHKQGSDVKCYMEGFKKDFSAQLPSIVEAASKLKHDFIVEGELHFKVDDKFVARPQIMTCIATGVGEPYVFLFDLVYFDEDISDKPFEDRYKILEKSFDVPFVVLPQVKVKSQAELEKVSKDLINFNHAVGSPHVEGVVVRVPTMPYVFGSTNLYAKYKLWLELKVVVTDVEKAKNGYVYECGLIDDSSGEVVPIGKTFVTKIEAKEGDVINVMVEELILYPDGKVAWGKPTVMGPSERQKGYTIAQAIDIASRGKCLKEVVSKEDKTEEDTPAGERVWNETWYKMYPPSGKGKFVYQLHFRGLDESEIKLGIEELLKRGRSVHADLRFEARNDKLWGFTVFMGEPGDVLKGKLIENMQKQNYKFQGTFKLAQPKAWLDIGDPPYISAPGEAGSTSKKYAKFFKIDSGTYEIGVWRQHMLEIFVNGSKVKGRMIFEYAPVGGRRIWLVEMPQDQTPYADKHELEGVVSELRQKKQEYLVWSKPGDKPKLIEISKFKKGADEFGQITKLIKMKPHYVLAPVLVPDEPDYYGDVISEEDIRRSATEWLHESRAIGVFHEDLLSSSEARVVDSFVAPCDIILTELDGTQYNIKKGTWLLGIEILDNLVWDAIEKGFITGLSIEGIGVRTFEKDTISGEEV